jgi:tetratricopeptide (TPR) repeat protein
MKKVSLALILVALILTSINAQQPQTKPDNQPRQQPQKPAPSIAQTAGNYIVPADVNVRLESDFRTFVVMAAINIAGFDYETGGQALSPARAELRKDLATRVPADVKQKLAAYYQAHRRPGVDEGVDAARYAALSLMMTPPPSFTIYLREGVNVPEDLKALFDFSDVVREFYLKSNIRELAQKYLSVSEAYATEYRRPVGMLIYQLFDYFKVRPETVVNMKPLVLTKEQAGAKIKQEVTVARSRTRQVFIIPDPLAALGSSFARDDFLNAKDDLSRRIGDDYNVAVGPSQAFNLDAVRNALIRFVLDPMIERKLKVSLEYRDPMIKLVKSVPTSSKEFQASVYQIIRESLARAAEARLKRLDAGQKGAYTEDEATYDLAQAYLRGAVLSFHFYESLKSLENVGIGIEDFYDQMLATAKWEREEKRADEFMPVVARVSATRKKSGEPNASTGNPAIGAVAKKVLESDDLIRQNRIVEARALLEEVLGAEPKNARALFGMARLISQSQSKTEEDAKADENDKIQAQHDRLEMAIKLYRQAIENASIDSERWMMQWCYVLIGRIYDFQEFRNDAIAEYEKAIALGADIPNGAYKEAMEGKAKPYGQK